MSYRFLFFGAHPDDVEMGASGTILRLKQAGHWVGITDLTRGELGTRGSAETREKESQTASSMMAIDNRDNLDLGDGSISPFTDGKSKVIANIRKHRPDFVFCNAPRDRHIDHGYAAQLVADACFLSGLKKYEVGTSDGPHRPKNIFHYIQDYYLDPNMIVDITEVYEQRMQVILAYKTQFHQGQETEQGPKTPISSPEFLEFFKGRASQMGRLIGTRFGEGFIARQPINAEDLSWFN